MVALVRCMGRRDGRSLSRREHPITMRAEARDEDRKRIGYRSNGSYASHSWYMLASHVGRSSGDYLSRVLLTFLATMFPGTY